MVLSTFYYCARQYKTKDFVTKKYNIYPQKGFQKAFEGCFGRSKFQNFLCRPNMVGDVI